MRKAIPVIVSVGLAAGCQTWERIRARDKQIAATALKTDDQTRIVAQQFAKEAEACEAAGFQDCAYGLRFGPHNADAESKIARGICAGLPSYFSNSDDAPCRWTCANIEMADRKDCVKIYGYTAILNNRQAISTFPLTESFDGRPLLSDGLRPFWEVLETITDWNSFKDMSQRAAAIGERLFALNVKKIDGIREYIIVFGYDRVGFVRRQDIPAGTDGQFFLGKAEEKYGKAQRLKGASLFAKLYGWPSQGKTSRYLGVTKFGRADDDIGVTPMSRSQHPVYASASNAPLPSPTTKLALGDSGELVTVIADVARIRQILETEWRRVQAEKEKKDAERNQQKQQEIDSIRY